MYMNEISGISTLGNTGPWPRPAKIAKSLPAVKPIATKGDIVDLHAPHSLSPYRMLFTCSSSARGTGAENAESEDHPPAI
jgi:hypothetical protein